MKKDRTIKQICKQCSEPYTPTRIGVQKFCSASCRSRYWFLKQQDVPKPKNDLLDQVIETKEPQPQEIKEEKPISIENMSPSGVGNAFWGSLAAEVVTGVAKNAWKRDSDKTATKGDLDELYKILNKRYLPIIRFNPSATKSTDSSANCDISLEASDELPMGFLSSGAFALHAVSASEVSRSEASVPRMMSARVCMTTVPPVGSVGPVRICDCHRRAIQSAVEHPRE